MSQRFVNYQSEFISFLVYIPITLGFFHTGVKLVKYYSVTFLPDTHCSSKIVFPIIIVTSFKSLLSIFLFFIDIILIKQYVILFNLLAILIYIFPFDVYVKITKQHAFIHTNIHFDEILRYKPYQTKYRDGL